jgi:TolB-like protein/DNA-binding winged helix-turn-helix (wHTH) protein/Flp pilus assembly protein TadD
MPSQPVGPQESILFGEDFEFDLRPRRLRRGGRVLKLERIPLDILLLLLQHPGEILTREEIVARVWGAGVFLDTDNSIRGAIRKIRQVLKDDPEQPRFIQTITGKGYRFIAPVTGIPLDGNQPEVANLEEEKEPGMETQVHAQEHRGPGILRVYRWPLAGLAAVLVLGIAFFQWKSRQTDATPPKIRSLAVLPLKNLSSDPSQGYLADGMTEELIGRLAAIHDLRVISRTSVMQFQDPKETVPAIARTLGVDAIVEGSVIRDGNRIRVHAQLIRANDDEHFWSEIYDREMGDVLSLESEVAESIARRVEVTVTGEERARLVAARPVPPEAYESYLKGLVAKGNSRAEVEASIANFDEAIRRDPTFAPAYVGLANAYDALGSILVGAAPPSETRPKVISAAQRALELDPELPEAHVILGYAYMSQWRWAEAEAEFRRALDLSPNDALAHGGLSDWLLGQGQIEEALAWARRERELDPLGKSGESIAWDLFCARRYNDAIHEFRNELAVKPDDGPTLWNLGWALIFNHQVEEAIPVLEKALSVTERSPGVISALVWAYARDGRRADALRLLEELKKRAQTGYVPAAAMVNAYLGLGDKDEAFVWFERACQEKSNLLKFIKVFPPFDPVRSDPRFQELVRRVGLN